MSEPLFVFLGLPVTAYALGLVISLALCAILAYAGLKRKGFEPLALETFLLLMLPLGLLLGRGVYVLIRLNFFLGWPDALALRFWQGGYSVFGLILAFLLSGFLSARITKVSPNKLLDALSPYGLLMLGLARFCEGLSAQGFGQEVAASLRFFPLAVVNEYEEWRFAIFMLEGVAALIFALIVLWQKGRDGNQIRLTLILFFVSQILFESLREDEVLSWGFVKASQLLSAVGLFVIINMGLFGKQISAWRGPSHLALALFFILIFIIVGLEFAIDKTTLNINLIYLVFAACCAGLGLLAHRSAVKEPA